MRRLLLTALLGVASPPLFAGDIAGMRPALPPFVERDLEVSFSNDFLGRGGSVDDFRTQQIIIAADFAERWTAVVDHSVLTLTDPATPGRIDQFSASLGYRLLQRADENGVATVTAGLGVRGIGDFAGERMQNGFHRLIGSDVENLPYSDVDETFATAWVDAETYAPLRVNRQWTFGYWLRGRALVTGDGQVDSNLSAMAVASRAGFDAWAGLRQDWRTGYDEPIQRATAAAEQDLAFVLGLRVGSLVLETVQQFDNDASFGQLRLVSSEAASASSGLGLARVGLDLGFLLPDVHLHLGGRLATSVLVPPSSAWRESVFISVDAGEPQLDDPSVYANSTQLGAGLEWERSLTTRSDWLAAYIRLGAGWRRERLVGDGTLADEESASVNRAVLLGGAGLRFHATTFGERWRYRIQLGLSAWLPVNDARLVLGDRAFIVQQPNAALFLGVSFDFS